MPFVKKSHFYARYCVLQGGTDLQYYFSGGIPVVLRCNEDGKTVSLQSAVSSRTSADPSQSKLNSESSSRQR